MTLVRPNRDIGGVSVGEPLDLVGPKGDKGDTGAAGQDGAPGQPSDVFFVVTEAPYNAVGDGTTDDTAAIQAAMDDAYDHKGTVYFPGGTYKITSTLTLLGTLGIKMVGSGYFPASAGTGTSILKWFGSDTGCLFEPKGSDGMVISELQFAANSATYKGNLVWFSNAAGGDAIYNIVERCAFIGGTQNQATALLRGDRFIESVVRDCHFERALAGIRLGDRPGGGGYAISDTIEGCSFNFMNVVDPPTGLGTEAVESGGTLTAGTYYYTVTAINEVGETNASAEANATITGSTGSVILDWADNPGPELITGWRIYRSTATGAETFLKEISNAASTWTDTGADSPTTKPMPYSNSTGHGIYGRALNEMINVVGCTFEPRHDGSHCGVWLGGNPNFTAENGNAYDIRIEGNWWGDMNHDWGTPITLNTFTALISGNRIAGNGSSSTQIAFVSTYNGNVTIMANRVEEAGYGIRGKCGSLLDIGNDWRMTDPTKVYGDTLTNTMTKIASSRPSVASGQHHFHGGGGLTFSGGDVGYVSDSWVTNNLGLGIGYKDSGFIASLTYPAILYQSSGHLTLQSRTDSDGYSVKFGGGNPAALLLELKGKDKIGFYGVSATTKPTALTAADASTVDTTYGTEEANVITNLRTRVNQLETKLQSLGLLS